MTRSMIGKTRGSLKVAALFVVATLVLSPAADLLVPVPAAAHGTLGSAVADDSSSGEEKAGTGAPEPAPSPSAEPAPSPSAEPTRDTSAEPIPTETPTPSPTDTPVEPVAEDADGDASPPADTLRQQGESAPATFTSPIAVVPTASRLAGVDRFATSVAASRAAFPDGAAAVLIVAGSASIDAIVATAAAGRLSAPVLYTSLTSVPAAVVAEVRRLGPEQVVVVGGTGVVSESVVNALRTIVPMVSRWGGVDRYETSRIALAASSSPTVYVSTGASLVEPPLASVAAASVGGGSLLVRGSAPADGATLDALRTTGAKHVVIVGGSTSVGASFEDSVARAGFAVTRTAAKDPHELALEMLKARPEAPARAMVANVEAVADIAVAAALAGATRQGILYAYEPCFVDSAATHLSTSGLAITAIGGFSRLTDSAVAAAPCSVRRVQLQSQLNASIRSALAGFAGTFAVTVRQLNGVREVTHISGGSRLEPASMLKIFAAWAALTRVQQGRATLNTRLPSGVALGVCLRAMIHASDNYCHTDVVHWIGIAEINRMISSAGFTGTSYGSVPRGSSVLYAGNRSTTNDMSRMVQGLAEGTVLAPAQADVLLGWMRSQIWRSRIPSGIPPGIGQASKPGALWLASGLLQADTAIVYGPVDTYIVSVIGDDGPSQAALRSVSRAVYTHFHWSFGAAAQYPVQQVATRVRTTARSTPGGAVVLTLSAGVPLQVHETVRHWYQVQYGSKRLWVTADALRNR